MVFARDSAEIVINLLGFSPARSLGGQTYLLGFLGGLSRLGVSREIAVICDEAVRRFLVGHGLHFDYRCVRMPSRPALRLLFEQALGPRYVCRMGAPVVFFPLNRAFRVPGGAVVMIHDLVHRFYRATFPQVQPARHALLARLVDRAVRIADAIITPSRAIGEEVCYTYGVPDSRVYVVHEASTGTALPSLGCIDRDGYTILVPCHCLPHKNVEVVVSALGVVRDLDIEAYRKMRVVITGPVDRFARRVRAIASACGLSDRIHFTGYVSTAQMEELYRCSALVVLPSLYEGFGLPIAEAQRIGVPLVVSDLPVLREVSGGHALFFPPKNVWVLAETILAAFRNPAMLEPLVLRGQTHSGSLSWETHAAMVLKVLGEMCPHDYSPLALAQQASPITDRADLVGLEAGDDEGADLPAAGPQLQHHGFVGRPAAPLALLAAPHLDVVDPHGAPQLTEETVPPEHLAKAGQQVPGNPLANLQLPRQGVGGDPDLEERHGLACML